MDTGFMGITLNLQKKYNKVNELQDVTKQMADTLQRNDLYSFRLLLKMRTEVMFEIENLNYAQEEMLKDLPEREQTLARGALSMEAEEKQLNSSDLQRMNDIYQKIKRSLQNTIHYDKAINLKVAGNNSFYKN
ncbi:MAG: hypothetical protein PHG19_09480 [Anaerotignum sp.]|nr:hypothetical protein [Anaerotignum sp.]